MLDLIQEELECCGVLGVSDWKSRGNGTVPASCCSSAPPQCEHQAGCLHQVEFQIFRVYFWTSLTLLPVLTFSIVVLILFLVGSCFPG